ncbi:UNVERIFIED_CONTAM: hypothetical protein HDU68_011048 [Siphonaria sp. JEL0065]|nr:hypothetical protein HDU68_011048 [Siphonaria sp. JEL0065]
MHASCQHQHLISSIERDLIQLIRRSVRDPQLGEDAEAFVGETLRGIREFLSAIEIVGEMSPSSYDTLISAADNMAAFILTCALQAAVSFPVIHAAQYAETYVQGLPAKLIPTDNLISPNFSTQNMDGQLFSHIVSNLTHQIEADVYSDKENEPIIPIFSGSFGHLPSHLSLYAHLPQKQHTSLFAALLTLALAPFSNTPPTLYLLHTHISGIHSIDPRVTTSENSCEGNVSRQIKNLDLSAAVQICGVGETGGLLSSSGLKLLFYDTANDEDGNVVSAEGGRLHSKVYIAKIGDIFKGLGSEATNFETIVQRVGTRIFKNGGGGDGDTDLEKDANGSIVIYQKGVVVLRIDRLLESSNGPSADSSDNTATTLLLESHRILGFVFKVLDECGVRVCTSSSSYKTVTVAVVEEGFESSDSSLSRTPSAVSFADIGNESSTASINAPKSNLQKAIEKLQVLKATISVYPNKGLISLISTSSSREERKRNGVELTRKLLNALTTPKIHIEMCSQGVGAVGVSVVVNEDRVFEGVRAVHEAVYCGK